MRPARWTPLTALAAALLALTACSGGADDPAPDAAGTDDPADLATDDDADAPAAADDDAAAEDGPVVDDDGSATDERAVVTLDGVALELLPDTLQCVAFPDGTDRIVAELADPAAGPDDPTARMSFVLDRTEDGEAEIRVSPGLNLPDEQHGDWLADPDDAAAVTIDPDVGASVDDLMLTLRGEPDDQAPLPTDVVLTAAIDCT